MSCLYLDFGNTRVKWCLGGEAPAFQEYDGFGAWFEQLVASGVVDAVVFASVLAEGRQGALTEVMRRQGVSSIRRCVVTSEALGVVCAYEDVSRLGIDRWLAVLAVWERYRGPCLVADLGTAATLDIVDGAGNHQGGYIVSGLTLSLRGLLAGTDNIKPDPAGFHLASLLPGRNTAEAVYHGALHSLVALIQSSYQNLLKSCPEAKLILAGGDAPLVGSHIGIDHELIEGLVFDGMRLLERANLLVEA